MMKEPSYIHGYKTNITIVAVIFVAIASAFLYLITKNTEAHNNLVAQEELDDLVTELDNDAEKIFGTMCTYGWNIKKTYKHKPDSLSGITQSIIENFPNLHSVDLCINPEFVKDNAKLSFLSYRDSAINVIKNTSVKGDYTKRPIWTEERNKENFISEPHVSPTTGSNIICFLKRFKNESGNHLATLSFNYTLQSIGNRIDKFVTSPYIKVVLVSKKGNVISSPDSTWLMMKYNEIDNIYKTDKYVELVDTVQEMEATLYMYINWDKYFASANDAQKVMLLLFLGLVILVVILNLAAKKLKKTQEQLIKTILEREKTDNELKTAQAIQNGLLPANPKDNKCSTTDEPEVYGFQKAAKEVGGDLYDFCRRDGKLFFCIGDVSGKGIPASLFMTSAMSAFRVATLSTDSPSGIVTQINRALSSYSTDCTFVTMIVAVIDLKTKMMTYSNAGHNQPLLISKGKPEFIPLPKGTPIAFFEDATYNEMQLQLNPHDILLLYTDGVNEAESTTGDYFGDERLVEVCSHINDCSAKETIDKITMAISQHTKGAEQNDDITMLCIKINEYHPNMSEVLEFGNNIEEIQRISTFIEELSNNLKLDSSTAMDIQLAVEEAVVNIIEYAYPKNVEGKNTINVSIYADQIVITLTDHGKEFDPTSVAEPDVSLPPEERSIGGLGIMLTKKIMDEIQYERINEQNIFRMIKRITP